MKRIIVLGSTGSVGTQTLQVIARHPQEFRVEGLVCYRNYEALKKQQARFPSAWMGLLGTTVNGICCGEDVFRKIADADFDLLVVATTGILSLQIVEDTLQRGIDVALANKELLITAGELLTGPHAGRILPVDSEHSAIWQCTQFGEKLADVEKIILTASGGSMLGKTREQLQNVTPEQVLRHPNWSMGKKITVDSATLMNKGFELMEAHHLFGLPMNRIEAVVHPQSIVHGLIRMKDGAFLAQLSSPDMKLPIQLALTYPKRLPCEVRPLDLTAQPLTFFPLERKQFPCFDLALLAAEKGGIYPTVLNAANDVAVQAFLEEKISYLQIPEIISHAIHTYSSSAENKLSIQWIIETNADVKRSTSEWLKRGIKG